MSTVHDVEEHAKAMVERLGDAHEARITAIHLNESIKRLEREARKTASGANAQAREDAVVEAVEADPAFARLRSGLDAHTLAREENEARAKYHELMARAHTAAIGLSHDG